MTRSAPMDATRSVLAAAQTGGLCAERPGQLNGEGPDAARRAQDQPKDQELLPGLNPPWVPRPRPGR